MTRLEIEVNELRKNLHKSEIQQLIIKTDTYQSLTNESIQSIQKHEKKSLIYDNKNNDLIIDNNMENASTSSSSDDNKDDSYDMTNNTNTISSYPTTTYYISSQHNNIHLPYNISNFSNLYTQHQPTTTNTNNIPIGYIQRHNLPMKTHPIYYNNTTGHIIPHYASHHMTNNYHTSYPSNHDNNYINNYENSYMCPSYILEDSILLNNTTNSFKN